MKIKIDQDGFLRIKRGLTFRQVKCPFAKDEWCCDACALFGEPEIETDYLKIVILELCHKKLTVKAKDFEDER